MMAAAGLDARVYRACLRACPPHFRRDYADQMARDFDDAQADAKAEGHGLWRVRLLLAIDLVRTLAQQWTRTGWPIIGLISFVVAIGLAEAMATLARRATMHIPQGVEQVELLGLILLATISVCLIAMTITLTLWAGRPIRRRRR